MLRVKMLKQKTIIYNLFLLVFILLIPLCHTNDILGCGGFVKSHASIDFSKIEIGLYTRDGSLKEKTECAPTNGYYFLPLYEKGEYVLKVHPPAGWSFEPSQVELDIDGENDQCSSGQDINFAFNGFGITGKVVTAGQASGPSGISVQLINEKGDIRNTVTTSGGDFHFTPVIPGKYVVKASHLRWKLEPSQTVVQVKEGNTALTIGALTVKGYDVSGSVTSFGSPIGGVYVLLYSKEENPKFRVEGCKTALLQGVPDAPICHSVTDANGEFKFDLVPAGEYKVLALAKSPGQAFLTYNIKPDSVPFSVLHDSLYIKNAFEVTGFTVVGSALSAPGGGGVSGARVALAGQPVATTDARGQFTLSGLRPGVYTLSLQHEHCIWEEIQLSVGPGGPDSPPSGSVSRWRVCGALAPPEPRRLLLRGGSQELELTAAADGTWCTFLSPGSYSARVAVSEQEQRDGLQFYPEWQQIAVGGGPVSGVSFSQVRARVRGAVRCGGGGGPGGKQSEGVPGGKPSDEGPGGEPGEAGWPCGALRVSLRPLAADGAYAGPPRYAPVVDGEYSFEEVVPGSVEVSVAEGAGEARLCWQQARHNVAVTQDLPPVPDFILTGLAVMLTVSHDMEVEYESSSWSGALPAVEGRSRVCVPPAGSYELTPRGCHRVTPQRVHLDMAGKDVPSATFVATAHANVVTLDAPVAADDVRLHVTTDEGTSIVDLEPEPRGDEYVYTHTLYLAEGEAATLLVVSSRLVVPGGARALRGSSRCARAASLRGVRARSLAGRLRPPVEGVRLTLTGGDVELTQITTADGTYGFGPLDASVEYAIVAEKESYVFGEREPSGDIRAHKLAEIEVELVDDADDSPLEDALVSVSGGSFRSTARSRAGSVRAGSLRRGQYYVKPHMKEYRFQPPHQLVNVDDGQTHALSFRGVRVSWSARGRVVSLCGAGAGGVSLRAGGVSLRAGGVSLRAAGTDGSATCPQQDAVSEQDGSFRIRGLVPGCSYRLLPKDARLAETPGEILMGERDAEGLRLVVVSPPRLTDVSVLVVAAPEHYRTLRLSLSGAVAARLDAAGAPPRANPGLALALPRLPADNRTYVLTLDSTLSRATHDVEEHAYSFVSDGRFKHFEITFDPKVKSSEQELRQSSLLVLPVLVTLVVSFLQRHRLLALLPEPIKKVPRKKAQ